MTVDKALEWADQVADNAPGATYEAILAAHDAEWQARVRDAFESGYCQGHNDTVESCVREYQDAYNDYARAALGGD